MPRYAKLSLGCLFALVVVLASTLVGAVATTATAAAPVKVQDLSATAGPLNKAMRIRVQGRGLGSVSKAKFGDKASRIVSKKDTSLVLVAPKRSKAASVKVTVFSRGKWLRIGTYHYVAKPKIFSLNKTTGEVLGGESVVIRGTALDRVTSVVVSGSQARITKRSAKSLAFLTPPSVVGASSVRITSPGGSAVTRYTYVSPTPQSEATITTTPSTFEAVADDVQWVIGSGDQGYILSLAPGSELPSVGAPFYLAAGGAAYASGLAGRVVSLAAQPDDSVRVEVESVPLEEVFTALDVSVTERVEISDFDPVEQADSRASAPSGSLGRASRSAFSCDSEAGFLGSLEIKVKDLTPHFEDKGFGNPFQKNEVIAYISGKTEISGSIKAEAAMECTLSSSWQNSHRKVVSLGYGVTYSIAPEVRFSVSASGSVKVTRTQAFLYGTHWKEDGGATRIQDAGTPQVTVEGQLAGTVSLEGGVSNRLGLLDRVGIELEGLLYIEGEARFTAGTTGQFCLAATYGLKAPVKLFLDYWVGEEAETLFTISLQFGSFEKCGRIWGSPDNDAPEITTHQLPDATVGRSYAAVLSTADNRNGAWGTRSALPAGLSLDASNGRITGTPTGGVGSRTIVVTFEDADGQLSVASVSLTVNPSVGLGGGDIQATLTWSHAADMDLHAFEPDGTEIYYSNRVSANGGELDVDANVGCGGDSPVAENIRWPAGSAPSGVYAFQVVTYSGCGVPDLAWHLVVRVNGQIVIDESGTGTSGSITLPYGASERRGPAIWAERSPSRDPKA